MAEKIQTKKPKKKVEKKEEIKIEEKMEKAEQKEKAIEETKKEEKEKSEIKKEKPKKTEAIVNAFGIPVSTKKSAAVCKFIKGKTIFSAISDLEKVISKKTPVPMKGEIPHRKGKIMSGRYPKRTAEHFIKLLKTLSANAEVNGINEPVISEAVANIASRPFGRFGRVRKKRTHVRIIARQKINKNKNQ